MSTLLLRIAGPMQSWGTQSRFTERDTGHEPSKSGIIGLLCAALGKPRHEAPNDRPQLETLARLRMAVRTDRQGDLLVDYHTAGGTHRLGERYGVAKADGSRPEPVISRRYYLSDASFLVGLEGGDDALLAHLHEALAQPHWQICLGRKGFVPGAPVHLPDAGPTSPYWRMSLISALRAYAWPRDRVGAPVAQLPVTLDVDDSAQGTSVRRDLPIDFAGRLFALRHVRSDLLVPQEPISQS